MKNLEFENCNLVELDSNEITKISGGNGWGSIYDCIYGKPIPVPKLDLDFKTFDELFVS